MLVRHVLYQLSYTPKSLVVRLVCVSCLTTLVSIAEEYGFVNSFFQLFLIFFSQGIIERFMRLTPPLGGISDTLHLTAPPNFFFVGVN